MRRQGIAALVLSCVLFIGGCGDSGLRPEASVRTELLVSAAASLTDSLKEIQALYEQKNNDITLRYNFGSSGTLQQQIEQGAPVDLFLSAGKKQMAALVDKSLVEKDRQTGLLRNELVVIVPADSDKRVDALSDLVEPGFVKLAIGEPATVPAGGYTREALEHYGLWDKLQSRFVYAKDVRQVLTYVETGNADAGFVYKTDALTSKKVKVASVVGPGSHQAIEYPIGIVRGSAHMEEAERFYDFLRTAEALAIFEKYGFSLPNERGTK